MEVIFANNYGVLVYDGKTWSNIILDNNDPARSIATDKLGNIIVGSRGNLVSYLIMEVEILFISL